MIKSYLLLFLFSLSAFAGDGTIANPDIHDSASIALSKLQLINGNSVVGNISGGSTVPNQIGGTQLTTILGAFTGDSGSGGVKGVVPAPSSGDTAAGKFLHASGGWSVPVTVSTRYSSTYLGSGGTRVTSDPTALGEWRSQIRNGGAQTFTDTNAVPAFTPSSASGFKLYGDNTYAGGGTSTEPNLYKIFVGINKRIQVEFYSGTGRTGFACVDGQQTNAATAIGVLQHYDPTTGIYAVRPVTNSSTSTAHYSGVGLDFTLLADVYFDILISD